MVCGCHANDRGHSGGRRLFLVVSVRILWRWSLSWGSRSRSKASARSAVRSSSTVKWRGRWRSEWSQHPDRAQSTSETDVTMRSGDELVAVATTAWRHARKSGLIKDSCNLLAPHESKPWCPLFGSTPVPCLPLFGDDLQGRGHRPVSASHAHLAKG